MFGEPANSQHDLKFSVGKIPVRVHPSFWIIGLLMMIRPEVTAPEAVNWIFVLFVSILFHELGHAWAAQYYLCSPRVVLYSMGGLAIFDPRRRDPLPLLYISLAGPAAGFVLALALLLLLALIGRLPMVGVGGTPIFMMYGFVLSVSGPPLGAFFWLFVWNMMHVNIYWGLVNLLPVYPLDGGQSLKQILRWYRHPDVERVTHRTSFVTAVIVAILFAISRSWFPAFMFGYLAYQSWLQLQTVTWSRWDRNY